MKRERPRDGVIITITTDDPAEAVRTVRVSSPAPAILRLAALLLGLVAAMSTAPLLLRGGQLGRLQTTVTDLERALAARERQLAVHRSQLDDAAFATARLLADLGNVGALVREVQSYAGLAPIATLAVTEPTFAEALATVAVGGPDNGPVPAIPSAGSAAPAIAPDRTSTTEVWEYGVAVDPTAFLPN